VHILAFLLLTFSLSGSRSAPPLRTPTTPAATAASHPNGKWYLAETGHAVYCYGPVVLVKQPEGTLQHVATYCKGDKILVPLKD